MCCSGAQWKREEVPDHKWDFVDVREFHNSGFMSYLQYCFVYVLVIKSVLVYCSDVYTMVLLLASNHWAGSILQNSGGSSAVTVPFSIGKWIFFGCIIFSFLLLFWEAKKSRAIIRSRDISYAFTNVMANNYYSMKSYDHFCFFSQINNSKKKKDDFAFFVFFTFKGWKRLLLADAPRQVINGLTLYSFAKSVGFTTDITKWYNGSFAKASVLASMAFTVVIWIGSFVLLMAAAFLYVPLLCYIQGNLKEYCCHKVDKRIAELMKRKNRKRLAKEAAIMRKEAMGDYSHLKDKKGHFKAAPLPQPTLPKIGFEELISDTKSERGGAASVRGAPRSAPHAYPPPHTQYAMSNASAIGYTPSMNRWAPSERDFAPEKTGYAESVMSTDRFISHQAPMAGTNFGLNGAPTYTGALDQYDQRGYSEETYAVAPYAQQTGDYAVYAKEPTPPTRYVHSEYDDHYAPPPGGHQGHYKPSPPATDRDYYPELDFGEYDPTPPPPPSHSLPPPSNSNFPRRPSDSLHNQEYR